MNAATEERPVFVNMTSHQLTDEQREAVERAGMEIVEMPEDLKKKWASVDPEADAAEVDRMSGEFIHFLFYDLNLEDGEREAVVLLQGEPVLVYSVLHWMVEMPYLIPVVATTRRESVETKDADGTVRKVSVFRHVRFRGYTAWYDTALKHFGLNR